MAQGVEMSGSLLSSVYEHMVARCREDQDVLAHLIREMVQRRWSENEVGMHVACQMPKDLAPMDAEVRRLTVAYDVARRCMDDERFLRVTLSTDVGGWTDNELERYAEEHLASPAIEREIAPLS